MDKEKIELAFKCVDALAAGLDPISGKLLPKDSAINQGDVVRALFYARSIIGQYRTKSAQPQQPMVQILPVRSKGSTSLQNSDVSTPTPAPVVPVSHQKNRIRRLPLTQTIQRIRWKHLQERQ